MAKKIDIPKDNNIIDVAIEEAMPENYLPYAVEVAKDRALPDVRDGLKPVHRRILYGAYLLKAFPDRPYYKSARIVGDILGKFHPHGDISVYDAMVILAQDFSTRKPLIDGHGNWGSIDGDGAAAMRYTEARLTSMALEMIKDIEKDVVDMIPNYSETEMEPKVLPASYPNLLVNGTFGIAVGLATNIPPHNLGEVIDGTLAYIDNNDIGTRELMHYIKGPDLPTGGILIGKDSLIAAYEKGEGKVTLRAKTSIEKLENGRLGIVITEFPYRRNKAKLLQNISEMTGDKRHSKALDSISDIRDESDRTGIRAVIEFKKSADYDVVDKVLKYLFKRTDLQCNLTFNMVAIADGKPETLGLKSILKHYVNHRKEIVTRRTRKELEIAEKRFHIVEGFIKAIDIMDQIIATIRSSKSKKEAGENLVNKFGFTAVQAEAILELMLYRLTGLEIKEFQKEHRELEKLIKKLKGILSSESQLMKVIKEDLLRVKKEYNDDRRTEIIEDDKEAKIDLEDIMVSEDVMITLSNDGFIKRIPLKSYNRLNSDLSDIEYREGDFGKYLIPSNTKDVLILFTDKGNMYQARGNSLPECKWKDKGERIDSLIRGLDLNEEKIVNAFSIDVFNPDKCFVLITSKGMIKKTSLEKFSTNYSRLSALKLKDNDSLVFVELRDNGEERKNLRVKSSLGLDFTIEEPEMQIVDRNILGSSIVNLSSKDFIISVEMVENIEFYNFTLGINEKGMIRVYSGYKRDSYQKVKANSFSDILIFTNRGNVYKIKGFMVQGIKDNNLKLWDFVDSLNDEEKIIKVVEFTQYNDEDTFVFFTKSGMIKKTFMKEFVGDFQGIPCYKFKEERDELVAVEYIKAPGGEALVITELGMAIRFPIDSVNSMGRIATGVTAISLKEEDKVMFGSVILNSYSDDDEISVTRDKSYVTIKTQYKEERNIDINFIKLQNRAGRGTSIMTIVMDDKIIKVDIA